MKTLKIFAIAVAFGWLSALGPCGWGADGKPLRTGLLGGVTTLTPEDLQTMQKSPYVLHARGGAVTKVPVQKSRLPHDPKGHVQSIALAMGPEGNLYVGQPTIMCKSTDGGRTWTSYPRGPGPSGSFQILNDNTFISVALSPGKSKDPPRVWASRDEGKSWATIAEIPIQPPDECDERHGSYSLVRLPDDTLLWGVRCRNEKYEGAYAKWLSGKSMLLLYRSRDRGKTWEGPSKICDWGHEGGIARLPSGKLLAVIRHQRPLLPTDPPELVKTNGGVGIWPLKHIFLAESEDGGKTWVNFRQLTTVFGQCYGFPASLRDGTVVVIHDTRYGPGVPSGRAMISRDQGKTWEDEAYYLYYGIGVSGYSQSVVLKDDFILTVAGTCDYAPARKSWSANTGRSELTAIRWRPQ